MWTYGEGALAIGQHGDADDFRECIRLYGGDCGNSWAVDTVYRSVNGFWTREYPVAHRADRTPRLDLAGRAIAPWRDGLVAIGEDRDSPLALHASSDGLRWERSWPRDQFPDLGHGYITTFVVDGDLAIVSGTIEPVGDQSVQTYFLQVGTIEP